MRPPSPFASICKIVIGTLLLVCCIATRSSAQTNRKISGMVTDTAKAGLPGVKVTIIAGKDSLTTATDMDGSFSFSKIQADQFSLQISALGYQGFKSTHSFGEKEKHMRLDPIPLKMSENALKEVTIKAKPTPIRFMQDTVEYNAGSFRVEEGDNVADLMKQFPGIEIDGDYNVKVGDKNMTKLRINGKDFFTNNVSEFIGKLPAGIVSKIQVIDDFGDRANFTGVKTGQPTKMLNIVTKPGMNKGAFGDASGNAGTNDAVGGRASVNLWNDSKQSSGNINANTSNNGAGRSHNFGIGLSHNDKLGKNSSGGFGYNFNGNGSASSREQVVESLNPEGNFINNTKSDGDSKGGSHSARWNLNFNNKKIYFQANVNGGYGYSSNQNTSYSRQSGVIRQDLNNRNSSTSSSPNINGSISGSKKLKDPNNILSANASFSLNNNNGDQHISTNTIYYDKVTGALLKDSLLERNVESRTNGQHFNYGINYSLGLKKPKDTLARQSINFNYNGAVGLSANKVSTFVFDNKSNKVSFVDTLSTSFNSLTLNQSLGINYNYGSSKMYYNIGFNANANMLNNRDLRLGQTTANNAVNYAPSVNYNRTLTKGKTISFYYEGSTRSPTIDQLQPIRNSLSLQNIIVGNPDLKTSFSHNLNGSFNYAHKSGVSMQVGIGGATTQNEIVSDVTLLPDTLNSLKQVTRYENINGNYQVNGNYLFHIPVKQNVLSFNYSGNVGFSNNGVLYNHQKLANKGFNFSQNISAALTLKKMNFNTQFRYSVVNNSNASSRMMYSDIPSIGIGQINAPAFFRTTSFGASFSGNLNLKNFRLNGNAAYNSSHNDAAADQVVRDNSEINASLSGDLTILKSYFTNFNIRKRWNYGYALANTNPLIINMGVGKRFLKSKALNLGVSGNDLLGQGNNINRVVSGNTIIDSRTQQPTRVFSINLSYNISNFGGKRMRVDPD